MSSQAVELGAEGEKPPIEPPSARTSGPDPSDAPTEPTPAAAELRAIWRLLRRLGLGPPDVDDAAQEVFLVAARREGAFDPEKRRAFLYGTALRVARHVLRRKGRQPPGLDEASVTDASAPSVEELVDQHKARELLDRVLAEMPLDLRGVFVLYELEDLSTHEIARALELRRGTVASRLRRAREFFQRRIKSLNARLSRRGERP